MQARTRDSHTAPRLSITGDLYSPHAHLGHCGQHEYGFLTLSDERGNSSNNVIHVGGCDSHPLPDREARFAGLAAIPLVDGAIVLRQDVALWNSILNRACSGTVAVIGAHELVLPTAGRQ